MLQQHLAEKLLLAGATLADPQRIDIRGEVNVGQDCFIDVNAVFEGINTLGDNVQIGPNCLIQNSVIGHNTNIKANSVLENAVVGEDCDIGPFARLRPGTQLANRVKIGNFVETKNIKMDAASKANHLSYLGDSVIGKEVNIGAGTITCNYDGANKHQTVIGDHAFIGSNSSLVAPVTIGDGATVGAGSTISKDAKDNALTVSRAKQITLENWTRPSKQPK